jgi:type I restriction enzyme S subunit
MYPLRPESTLVSRFLLAIVLGEHFSRFATAVSMRSGFPKLNREELGEYSTALPPYEEQLRIAAVMNTCDDRIRTEEAYCEKLKQLKKGLMHDLLSGRVRVNIKDEVAS